MMYMAKRRRPTNYYGVSSSDDKINGWRTHLCVFSRVGGDRQPDKSTCAKPQRWARQYAPRPVRRELAGRPPSVGTEKADRIRRRHRLPVVEEDRDAMGRRSGKVQTNAIEAGVKTNRCGRTSRRSEKIWAELVSQRRQLTEWLAGQGKVLTEVLAQQRQLMASTTTMFNPFDQQAVPRRRLEEIVCYGCHQKGHIRRNFPSATATLN